MVNYRRDKKDGSFHIHGHRYEIINGTRAQVHHGTAYKTIGGLTKKDLLKNKHGRIVSRRKYITAKRENRLVKHGYGAKKGKFGAVRLTKRRRGGYASNAFSPASVDQSTTGSDTSLSGDGIAGAGVTDFSDQGSNGVQLRAGLTGGRRRRRSRKGGYASNAFAPMSLSGDGIDGAGITNYGAQGSVGLQEQAGMAGGRRHRRHKRGGTPYGSALDPMPLSGGRRRRSKRRKGGMAPNISNATDISGEGYQSDANSLSVQTAAGLGN